MHKQTLWIFFFNQIQKWNQLFSREKINKFHTYTWNIIVVANSFGQETIPNFPSKNWRAFSLIIWNTFHYTWSGHSGLRSANSTRLDRARLIVPKEERKKEKNRKSNIFLACWLKYVEVKIAYRPRILDTHPLETWRIREISHGRAPEWANSMIFCRVESGKGRPLTYTPPSWFTPLCPEKRNKNWCL